MSRNASSVRACLAGNSRRSNRLRQREAVSKPESRRTLSYYETRVDELLRDQSPLKKAKMTPPTRSQLKSIRPKAFELYVLYMEIAYFKADRELFDDWTEYNAKIWNVSHDTLRAPFMLLAQFVLYVENDLSKI